MQHRNTEHSWIPQYWGEGRYRHKKANTQVTQDKLGALWSTHQLWDCGMSCWWSATEKPKKVPRSPNLWSVWVVSRLKQRTWLERANTAPRKKVQGWEEGDERGNVFLCPVKAAIAEFRSSSRASSVQQEHRGDSSQRPQRAKREKWSKSCEGLLSFPLLCRWVPCFLFLPLSSVCCCQSGEQAVKMRLLLLCVCASVFLSVHVLRLPLLYAQRETRGQVPWIARSLLPFPSLSLSLSFRPSTLIPSLLSLSWHQHSGDLSQNTRQGCQDTWRLLNRRKEGKKTVDCFICWVHTIQSASSRCSLLQVLGAIEGHKRGNTVPKVKKAADKRNERLSFPQQNLWHLICSRKLIIEL